MPHALTLALDIHGLLPDSANHAAAWVAVVVTFGMGVLQLRRMRAEVREREKLSELRMKHAEATGDFSVLDIPERPRRSFREVLSGSDQADPPPELRP